MKRFKDVLLAMQWPTGNKDCSLKQVFACVMVVCICIWLCLWSSVQSKFAHALIKLLVPVCVCVPVVYACVCVFACVLQLASPCLCLADCHTCFCAGWVDLHCGIWWLVVCLCICVFCCSLACFCISWWGGSPVLFACQNSFKFICKSMHQQIQQCMDCGCACTQCVIHAVSTRVVWYLFVCWLGVLTCTTNVW